jgi:hypothetical protein
MPLSSAIKKTKLEINQTKQGGGHVVFTNNGYVENY